MNPQTSIVTRKCIIRYASDNRLLVAVCVFPPASLISILKNNKVTVGLRFKP